MEKKNKYKALDFFLMRTPLLTFDNYKAIFPEEIKDPFELCEYSFNSLIELSKNPIIREAVAIASNDLYQTILRINDAPLNKQNEQAIKGLMKYIIRMITRPTPFGLFSGVTYGHFSLDSQLNMNEMYSYKKRARPDMEWIMKIIEKIENIPAVLEQLHVRSNPMIYYQGNRAKIPFTTRYGKANHGVIDSVSVKKSIVFESLIDLCKKPVRFSELIKYLQHQYPNVEKEITYNYMCQLIEQEFLISELRPSTIDIDPFTDLLNKINFLMHMDELKIKLEEVKQDINLYNTLRIGEGGELYNKIADKMIKLSTVGTSVLQVDLSLEDKSLYLNNSIREDVEKAAEILLSLSPPIEQYMEEYINEFLEKYGDYREVPILELLDEELGLGAPATYLHPASRRENPSKKIHISKEEMEKELILTELIYSSIHRKDLELNLSDEYIETLLYTKKHSSQLPLPSIELYFSLHATSKELLDDGEYTLQLGPNPGSYGAGKTFGRFMDLFPKSFHEEFGMIFESEKKMSPEKIWAEVSYLPSTGRLTNVILSKNFREYEISLATASSVPSDKQIPISDLVVGVRNGRFYLKSLKHNREVIPTIGHMLNFHQSPNIYRFLIEVGNMEFEGWSIIQTGAFSNAPFVPRIKYNRLILSPSTWKLRLTSQLRNKKMEVTEQNMQIQKWIENFCDEWQVPRYVYLIDSDNRILLDMKHPLHIGELIKILKLNEKAILIEHVGGFNSNPIKRNDGCLTAEIVFPLVYNFTENTTVEQKKDTIISYNEANNYYIKEFAKRKYLPGEEWFYAKIYGLESRQDEFLGLYWQQLINQFMDYKLIDEAYYIRYADPEPHIRMRFKIIDKNSISIFLSHFNLICSKWIEEGFMTKFVLDTYEPEIERYGGIELMKCAETLFSSDSIVAAELIKLMRFKQLDLDENMIPVLSVIHLLQQLGYNESNSYETLNQKFDSKEYLEEFRKYRRIYLEYLHNYLGMEQRADLTIANEGYSQFNLIFKLREPATDIYKKLMYKYKEINQLTNNSDDIVFSIIHMHMNRLIGIDREKERKIMILARHAMNSLVHYHLKTV